MEKIKSFLLEYKNWVLFVAIFFILIIVFVLGVTLQAERNKNRDLRDNEKESRTFIKFLSDSIQKTEKKRQYEIDSFETLLTSARTENKKSEYIQNQILKEKNLLEKEHNFANSLSEDSNLFIFARDGEEYISSGK